MKIKEEKAQGKIFKKRDALFAVPINVQNTNESVLFSWNLQRRVDPGDNGVKQVSIDLLGQSISAGNRSLFGHRLYNRFSHQNNPTIAQPSHQLSCAHTQQVAERRQVWIVQLQYIYALSLLFYLEALLNSACILFRKTPTVADDFSSPELLISTFPKCKIAARTLNTSD